jgi:mevalonate kinase
MNPAFKTRSNAKLLITGEYMVLRGAMALALPLVKGQQLEVRMTEVPSGKLHWTSTFQGLKFLETEINLADFSVFNSSNDEIASVLATILIAARKLNPEFLTGNTNYAAWSSADFNPAWGLGSSSTLIANIAHWANVNPYHLNQIIFNGSGYDIACALSVKPLHYRLVNMEPRVFPVIFNPPFQENLYFAFLGKKQDTRAGVDRIRYLIERTGEELVNRISDISEILPGQENLIDFICLLKEHDDIISRALELEPVSRGRFKNFPGYVKSLGAWGGDFILVCWQGNEPTPHAALNKLGVELVFPFNELVLQ